MENSKNTNVRSVYPGQIYKHFKNKMYQIMAVAIHSETGERLVIYQQLYGEFEIYARPYEMFVSEVDHVKYPEVKQTYRFELVKDIRSQSVTSEEAVQLNDRNSSEPFDGNGMTYNINDSEDDGYNMEEDCVNPYLIRFLEADTYEEKRNILVRVKGEITDRLIDDIAASMDVTVEKGTIDERFASLLACVDTMAKFEVNRLR